MRFIRESFWKVYFVVFALTTASNLISLLHPRSEVLIYYTIMTAFLKPNWVLHACAILSAVLTLVSLWTLFCRAFNQPHRAVGFFRVLFLLRIFADIFGHNYETVYLRSIMVGNPNAGWIVIAFLALFFFPSYKIHYDHAFHPLKQSFITPGKTKGLQLI